MRYLIQVPGQPDAIGEYLDEAEARSVVHRSGLVADMRQVKVTPIREDSVNALPTGIEPVKYQPLFGGGHWLYKFDNGYGASVICHRGSYGGTEGLYELAVAEFVPGTRYTWNRPNVEDVATLISGVDSHGIAGWLTLDDVTRLLGEIRAIATP